MSKYEFYLRTMSYHFISFYTLIFKFHLGRGCMGSFPIHFFKIKITNSKANEHEIVGIRKYMLYFGGKNRS